MKITSTILLLLAIYSNAQIDAIYVEEIPEQYKNNANKFDLDNTTYTIGKSILYKCVISRDSMVLDLETRYIKLSVLGGTKPFDRIDSTYSQTVIRYEYFDKDYNMLNTREGTGVIENDKNIWLHPPRIGDVGILQLSAFPFIRFTNQKTWEWILEASYSKYKNVLLAHYYEKGEEKLIQTELGELLCTPINAMTKSDIGTTTTSFIFNKDYGFVKMEFKNIDGTAITLEAIKE